MHADRAAATGAEHSVVPTQPKRRMRDAAMWKTPRSPLLFILSVETLCVTWLAAANLYDTVRLPDIGRFALLFAVAAFYAEGGDRIERLRRFVGYTDNPIFANAASLWCFAAGLILPVGLAGTFTVLVYVHTFVRAHRNRAARPFRMIYTAATEVLAAMAASTIVHAFGVVPLGLGDQFLALVAVTLAMVAYAATNQALVITVLYMLTRPSSVRSVMFSGPDQTLEFATLALAVLFAVSVVNAPYLAPFTLVLIVVLRRSALVRELQEQATRDSKTGLLNAGAWRREADREIARAERVGAPISVLMIDLDHFKQLNDEYGHQAGDATLKAVGECLIDALRGHDMVGRFGGEEFIAVLMETDERVSNAVAERLRQRIGELELAHGGRVTASIGVGSGIVDRHGLDELISIADSALYEAKAGGRDLVCARFAA